jgi:hypothetical protein
VRKLSYKVYVSEIEITVTLPSEDNINLPPIGSMVTVDVFDEYPLGKYIGEVIRHIVTDDNFYQESGVITTDGRIP